MDNTILSYETKDSVNLNRKKKFKGHSNAGYACQVDMSPDNRYVLSGDGSGKCYFWDWKSTKIVRCIEAHSGVCISAAWHPKEKGTVVTTGWNDATIKCWG